MGNPTLPTLDTIMKATIVEPVTSRLSASLVVLLLFSKTMETLAMKAFSTASRLKMTRPVPPFQVFLPYPFQFATSQTFGLCWGGTTLGDTTYFRACRYINSAKPDLSNGTRKDSRDWSHIMC